MPRPVSEQVIVVVGGSSGIGLCTAFEAARRGAKVVLAARNARDLETAAEQIVREGGEALPIAADVTDYDAIEALARAARERFGRVDSWVNAAAVSAYATFRQQSLEDFRRILDVNFMGQVHCARAALPLLEETGGALICIGSALSDRGVPLQGPYCASKHALKGWLDSLRVELRKEGSPVRVTLVKPSSIDTPLFNKARTRLGVMPRPIPPVYRPELAAEAILWAAEREERDVYVGGAGKLLSVAERISPSVVDLHQLHRGFEGQRTDWPEYADAPDNLYAPVEGDGGIRGDFQEEAKARSLYQSLSMHRGASMLAAAAILGVAGLALRRGGRGSRQLQVEVRSRTATGRGKRAIAAYSPSR